MDQIEVTEFVSPCGCPGCDKWADCDYCSGCIPVADKAWADAEAAYWAEYEENMRPFGEWLLG